uniref:transposase n=1 Tax=Candidatus Enterovibrio escicola TaxID=1927127 RepID=UPI0037435A41
MIIETVFDQLKNISQIEYSRHCSCISFMVNLLAGLIAYSFQLKKPIIKMTRFDKQALMHILRLSKCPVLGRFWVNSKERTQQINQLFK